MGYDIELKVAIYDVTKPGNSNHGHEFKDGPRGNGVVGPALSPDDRFAIIEYLKSLNAPDRQKSKPEVRNFD